MTVIRINSNEKIQNEEASTASIVRRRAKTGSTRSSSQPASSSSLPLHQKVSFTTRSSPLEHPMIDRAISSEVCMTDDDRLDDSKSRFKVAVSECVDELMKGQGYSRERAVKIILQKICPGDSQVNEEELFCLMSKYGIGLEDATRVLTISQTLHRTETELSISPAQAVDSLIRKIQDSNFNDETKKVSSTSSTPCTSSSSSGPRATRRCVKKNKKTPLVVLTSPSSKTEFRRSSRTKQPKFIKHNHNTPTMKSPNGGSKKQFKKMSSSEVSSSSGTGTSSSAELDNSVVKKSVRKEDAVVVRNNNNNNNSKLSNKRKRSSSAVPHNKLVSSLEQVVLENPNKRSRTSSL